MEQASRSPRRRLRLLTTAALAALLLGPARSSGEPSPTAPSDTLARPSPPTRVYADTWTSDLLRSTDGLNANGLLPVSYRGYFVGTLLNSYGERALSAGVHRDLSRSGALRTSFGYRVGLITGYDDRLFGVAGTLAARAVRAVSGQRGLPRSWARGRVCRPGRVQRDQLTLLNSSPAGEGDVSLKTAWSASSTFSPSRLGSQSSCSRRPRSGSAPSLSLAHLQKPLPTPPRSRPRPCRRSASPREAPA